MRPLLCALLGLAACSHDPTPPTPAPPTLVLRIVANGVLDGADPDHVAQHDTLRVGGSTVALVRADQADVLRGVQQAALQTAVLRLHVASGRGVVTAARTPRYWAEPTATWTCPEDADPTTAISDCARSWEGGEPDPNSATGHLVDDGFIELDVTADVRAFLDGTAPNFGWVVHGESAIAFDPRTADPSIAPQLALWFETPAPPDLARVADDHWNFVRSVSGTPIVAAGVNYDHDSLTTPCPLLIDEYWDDHFADIETSFSEIAGMGFHVVRLHLQFATVITAPGITNDHGLIKLDQLVRAAQRHDLLIDLTGLAHYRRDQIPAWFAALDDDATNAVEAEFWSTIAARYLYEPAILSYDLQNEPFVSSNDTNDVVSQPFAQCDPDGAGPQPGRGFSYVQNHFRHAGARWTAWVHTKYLTETALAQAWPDYPAAGETFGDLHRPTFGSSQARIVDDQTFRHEVAHLWTEQMVAAIRSVDPSHLITLGLTATSLPFQDQNAVDAGTPLFYSSFSPYHVGDLLDFISVHVYPKQYGSKDDEPLCEMILRGAWLGKPVVLEETFQYTSAAATYQRFMSRALGSASGWYSFYWGETPSALRATGVPAAAAIAGWIEENAVFARRVPSTGVTRTVATSSARAPIQMLLLSQPARLALANQYSGVAAQGQFMDLPLAP